MAKKKKFEKLPDLMAESEVAGMMIRCGKLKIWHEKGLVEVDLKSGTVKEKLSRKVGAYDETTGSQAVYNGCLYWWIGAQTALREEGREYAKLALCEERPMLAAINAAGGVDIFINDKEGLYIKHDIVHNPADNGKIFWADGGAPLISVSEFRGDLIGKKGIRPILEDLDHPIVASAYDPRVGLAVLDAAGELALYELKDGKKLIEQKRAKDLTLAGADIAFFDKAQKLALLEREGGRLLILDVQDLKKSGDMTLPEGDQERSLAADPEGEKAAVAIGKNIYLYGNR